MSATSPITDTTLFLYSAITSTQCKIDFVAVGAALDVQSGTAAMRYRRLTDRIKKASTPQSPASTKGGVDENSLFLYQCMVASKCKPDWSVVGVATGLKTGTASMRWRRLHDKIRKEHGSTARLQIATIAAQTATSTARAQKTVPSRKRKTKPAKEESEEESESDSKTDSGIEYKRIKTEGGADAGVPAKRQTRGKQLDFRGMADSCSSEAGTDPTRLGTSMYTDSGSTVEDNESTGEEEPAQRTPIKQAAPTDTKGMPAFEKEKASNVNDPVTPPASAAHSFVQNPKPTPSSTTPIQRQRAVPPPLTPVSGVIVRSIESDDPDQIDAQLDGMSDGRFVTTSKRSGQVSHCSTLSSQYYEADSEGASTSVASSLKVQAPTESDSDFLTANDVESVGPDDSVSMAGQMMQGGMKRMRKANNKEEGILGKLWGLFG